MSHTETNLPPLPPYDRIVHGKADIRKFWDAGSMQSYALAALTQAQARGQAVLSDEEIEETLERATSSVGLAHEIWAAAQLVPGEGIDDGVDRVVALLSRYEQAPAMPPDWKFLVTHSDGRVWLTIATPHGATATLSAVDRTGSDDATIVSQVLDYLAEMMEDAS